VAFPSVAKSGTNAQFTQEEIDAIVATAKHGLRLLLMLMVM
jgi:hypothetical protein